MPAEIPLEPVITSDLNSDLRGLMKLGLLRTWQRDLRPRRRKPDFVIQTYFESQVERETKKTRRKRSTESAEIAKKELYPEGLPSDRPKADLISEVAAFCKSKGFEYIPHKATIERVLGFRKPRQSKPARVIRSKITTHYWDVVDWPDSAIDCLKVLLRQQARKR